MSCESDLKDAVTVCLPLIHAAIRDIQKGIFPKNCFLNIGIPSCPLTNKVCSHDHHIFIFYSLPGNTLLSYKFLLEFFWATYSYKIF